jgi:hypothetical protein
MMRQYLLNNLNLATSASANFGWTPQLGAVLR